MKKRVIFIEPTGNRGKVFSDAMKLPLTGCLYLGTILKNAGHDVAIYNENILGKRVDPFQLKADIFCLTALTVSAQRAKELAMEIRSIHPQSKIIVGGSHATLDTDYFLDVVDHLVLGEAETVILPLIEGKKSDKIVKGQPIFDLDTLPLIDYSLLKGYKNVRIIPIMTSRGCPFDCSFCSVTKMFGKKFRFQSPNRILQEINHALTFFKSNYIFFYDDNFTANRKRVKELCSLLIDNKIEIIWSVQLRSEIALYPDLIEVMSKAGCDRVFIGFESINNMVLKALKKSQNRHDIEQAIKTFHRFGVKVHGMFMFGEDHDTVETLRETVDFAIEHKVDTVQFMVLTPLPGTPFYFDMEKQGRLYHKNWSFYDGMYVVFKPKRMSAYSLQNETVHAYKRFYSLRRTFTDLFKLFTTILIDALTLNFHRASRYSLSNIFLKMGGKVLIKTYTKNYVDYLKYLKSK